MGFANLVIVCAIVAFVLWVVIVVALKLDAERHGLLVLDLWVALVGVALAIHGGSWVPIGLAVLVCVVLRLARL